MPFCVLLSAHVCGHGNNLLSAFRMLRLCVPGYPAAKLCRNLFRKIAHPGIHPVPGQDLFTDQRWTVSKLVRLRLIRERLILLPATSFFLPFSLADIRAERDQLLVDYILKGIRLSRIGRALNGDGIWSFALEEEHQERFFSPHTFDSAILADTVVAACLFGNRQENVPQCFH